MRTPRDLLVALGGWPRRAAALVCLILAAGTALASRHGAGADEPHKAVVVARRPLAAGTVIDGSDVRVARWPADIVPAGAAGRTSDVTGHRAAGALARGEAVLPTDLLGPGLARGLRDGEVAVPVAVADPLAASMIHRGDRVDVLAGPNGVLVGHATPVVIARHALVLAVFARKSDGRHTGGTEIVIAASVAVAGRVATLGDASILAVVDKTA